MSRTSIYNTTVSWKGEHWGHIVMGNGPEMDFSAPPDAQGHAGVFTPEDGFVAAANTCIMMMFIWATERFNLNLNSYECRAEGTKSRSSWTALKSSRTCASHPSSALLPETKLQARGWGAHEARALQSAQKYSLVANSVKSEIIIEPKIVIV